MKTPTFRQRLLELPRWRQFVRWLAKPELEAQEKIDRENRKYLKDEYEQKMKDLEDRVNPLIEKLVEYRARFHHKPMPRIHVQAVMGLSSRFWGGGGPWGVDESEKEYIAHHIGHMIEKEIRYMKLVPTKDDEE